jgi:hypothetical protein
MRALHLKSIFVKSPEIQYVYFVLIQYVYFVPKSEHKGLGGGAVKRQKSFPPVPLTSQEEQNDAQARRFWNRRGFGFGLVVIVPFNEKN